MKEVRSINEVYKLLDALSPDWSDFPIFIMNKSQNLNEYLFHIRNKYVQCDMEDKSTGFIFGFFNGVLCWVKHSWVEDLKK